MTDTQLEALEPLDYPWGGDGGDPFEPIQKDVLAALIPTDQPYPAPLDQLLTLGSAIEQERQATFEAMQFLPEQADDLVRMARDRRLHTLSSDSGEVWAPIWAMRGLGRINASDRAADLMPLLDLDDDGMSGFLAEVFVIFGEEAFAPLAAYLNDRSRWVFGRTQAIDIMNDLVEAHPELRDRAVQLYTAALLDAKSNESMFNGFLLAGLLKFQATDALPAIRQAFEDEAIDIEIAGDWPDVLEELGQPIDEQDPLVQAANQRTLLRADRSLFNSPALQQPQQTRANQLSNQKNKSTQKKRKRKAAAAARKTNKKRR